ncbi:MAG: restriction endonuclease [Bacteroidetes bacterium]|nr:restriction endonuclease [Bacteroidota bacterium]
MDSIPTLDSKHDLSYIGDRSEVEKFYTKWYAVKDSDPNEDAKLKRKRGYKLEKIIYSILYNETLSPGSGFKKTGEQIDGSFTYNNLPFLLEAKWHIDPTEASKLYDFKGKVDGKFHLTSGVFISMSGFSEDAPVALSTGKIINVILFDGEEMELIISNKTTLKASLEYKIKMASKTGKTHSKIISETEID